MRNLSWTPLLLLAACTALPLPRNATYHPSDADLGVTRIVHGSLVIEMEQTRVLIDPWFNSGFTTRQTEPLGLLPGGLPELSAVVITHKHAEHFDPDVLRDVAKKVPRAIGPPALADALRKLGFKDVTPLDWWDSTDIGPIRVTAVPSNHAVPENGYVLATDRARAYFAGDTRYFDAMADIATAFPHLDVAFLPIGGERLMGLKRTMGPAEAVEAARLLDPRRIVPIGYGAGSGSPFVWYASDPIATFRDEAKAAGIAPDRIVVLEPGESWHYYR